MVECDSELVHKQLTRRLMPWTVHKDVMHIVQRRGQSGSTCRVRAAWVVHLAQPVSMLLSGKAVGSQASPGGDHWVTLDGEEQ